MPPFNRTSTRQCTGGERRHGAGTWGVAAVLALGAIVLSSADAQAGVFTLTSTDGLTVMQVNPNGSPLTPGVDSLTINGSPQVEQQWFWYRLGPTGSLVSLDTLSPAFVTLLNTSTSNVLPIPNSQTGTQQTGSLFNVLNLQYNGTYTTGSGSANFSIDVNYQLTGGGSQKASINETIRIANGLGSTISLPIQFFQFNHFDLNGDTTHQNVAIEPDPTNNPGSPSFYISANQFNSDPGLGSQDEVLALNPNFYEADSGGLNPLPGLGAHLAGNATLPPGPNTAGPGDVTWAFEWDFTSGSPTSNDYGVIAPGDSEIISKVRTITVPEPASSIVLLGLGGLWLTRRSRRSAVAQ